MRKILFIKDNFADLEAVMKDLEPTGDCNMLIDSPSEYKQGTKPVIRLPTQRWRCGPACRVRGCTRSENVQPFWDLFKDHVKTSVLALFRRYRTGSVAVTCNGNDNIKEIVFCRGDSVVDQQSPQCPNKHKQLNDDKDGLAVIAYHQTRAILRGSRKVVSVGMKVPIGINDLFFEAADSPFRLGNKIKDLCSRRDGAVSIQGNEENEGTNL